MNAWPEMRLGKLVKIKHGYAFKGEYFSDHGEFILLTPGNVHPKGGLKLKGDKETYYTGEFPPAYIFSKGDLVVVMTDLTQDASILGGAMLIDRPNLYLHNQRLGLVSHTNEIDRRFLYQYLNWQFFRDQVKASSNGSTVKHTSPSRICQCRIFLPPVPIQRKITAMLSTYDDLIENNNRRIVLLEKLAEEIYREWFVRFRFPGHEKGKVIKGIPRGWRVAKLKELATVNSSSISRRDKPETILYVDISSVSTNRIEGVTTYSSNEAPGRARRRVKHGDIIWSSVRPANRAYCLIYEPPDNLIVSTGFAVIRANLATPFTFLFFAVTSNPFVDQMTVVAKGAAYPATSFDDFEKAKLLVPSDDLLMSFHEKTELMFRQKHLLQEQVKRLQQTRDLLLPRLISGAISVEHLDIQFPPSMKEELKATAPTTAHA